MTSAEEIGAAEVVEVDEQSAEQAPDDDAGHSDAPVVEAPAEAEGDAASE